MRWLLNLGLTILKFIRGNGVSSLEDYKKKEVISELVVYDYLMFISQFPYLYWMIIPLVTFPLATVIVAIVCFVSLIGVMTDGFTFYDK